MYICYEHSMYISRIHVWVCYITVFNKLHSNSFKMFSTKCVYKLYVSNICIKELSHSLSFSLFLRLHLTLYAPSLYFPLILLLSLYVSLSHSVYVLFLFLFLLMCHKTKPNQTKPNQAVSSGFWIRDVDPISNDDNRYTKRTKSNVCLGVKNHDCIDVIY